MKDIRIVVVGNNGNDKIFVVNDNIYVLCGDAAMIVNYESATKVEKECAIGPDSDCALARSLKNEYEKQNVKRTEIEQPEETNSDGVFDPVIEEVVSDNTKAEAPQNKNCENKGFDPSAYKFDNSYFDKAVDFLTRCSGEDFVELVRYARAHGNTFFRCVKELADVVNADDCYCTAIIKMTRHLGDAVERKAFTLLSEAEKDEYDFVKFWEALQTINYYCE